MFGPQVGLVRYLGLGTVQAYPQNPSFSINRDIFQYFYLQSNAIFTEIYSRISIFRAIQYLQNIFQYVYL